MHSAFDFMQPGIPQRTSLSVFLEFVSVNPWTDEVDASRILTKDCLKMWLSTRKNLIKHPEDSFRRTVKAHLRAKDGRRAFPPKVEESLRKLLRKHKPWSFLRDSLQNESQTRLAASSTPSSLFPAARDPAKPRHYFLCPDFYITPPPERQFDPTRPICVLTLSRTTGACFSHCANVLKEFGSLIGYREIDWLSSNEEHDTLQKIRNPLLSTCEGNWFKACMKTKIPGEHVIVNARVMKGNYYLYFEAQTVGSAFSRD